MLRNCILVEQTTLFNTFIGTIGVFLTAFSTIETICMYLTTSIIHGNQSVIPFMKNIKHVNSCGPIKVIHLRQHLSSSICQGSFPKVNTTPKHVKCSMNSTQEHSSGVQLNDSLKVWSILTSANVIRSSF